MTGLMAIAERIKRYHEDPKTQRAKHQRHYPYLCAKGRQQRSQRLCRLSGQKIGHKPTARLNFNDPKMVAGLVQGIAAMEHGAKRFPVGDDVGPLPPRGPRPAARCRKLSAGRPQNGKRQEHRQATPGDTTRDKLPSPGFAGKVMAFRHRIDMIRQVPTGRTARAGMEMTIADYVAAA